MTIEEKEAALKKVNADYENPKSPHYGDNSRYAWAVNIINKRFNQQSKGEMENNTKSKYPIINNGSVGSNDTLIDKFVNDNDLSIMDIELFLYARNFHPEQEED